jgi:trans-aconitate 2-methyltransferase
MIERAESTGIATCLADIATWSPPEPVDIIFSNAALQWLPDHAALFPRLLTCLAPGGILAVQMPAMHNEPVRTLQRDIASSGPWLKKLSGVTSAPPILEPAAYYDLLSDRVSAIEIWTTRYWHVLRGKDPIVEWAMGTSLRPYLDALSQNDQHEFLAAYSRALRLYYPLRADGTVLLPFRRLFILAGK